MLKKLTADNFLLLNITGIYKNDYLLIKKLHKLIKKNWFVNLHLLDSNQIQLIVFCCPFNNSKLCLNK